MVTIEYRGGAARPTGLAALMYARVVSQEKQKVVTRQVSETGLIARKFSAHVGALAVPDGPEDSISRRERAVVVV